MTTMLMSSLEERQDRRERNRTVDIATPPRRESRKIIEANASVFMDIRLVIRITFP